MPVQSATAIRDLADQAYAEYDSGVVAGDEQALDWLDGLEQGLRWAVGDGTSADVAALIDRMNRVKRDD